MPRKNVPGGNKTPAKPSYSEEGNSNSRRKRMERPPKNKNKTWLDEIDDEDFEDFDIFDRDTESE